MQFVPSGIITLTTDFGHKDVFVGTMKGQILKRFPAAQIVDLTHEVIAHWPDEAGFWLARSYGYFPDGTVHVAVVDPGVGTGRGIIAMQLDTQLFLAPDNGLLGFIDEGAATITHRLEMDRLDRFGLGVPSFTFHGRDIFAPLAAELASGRIGPADIGPQINSIVPHWLEDPVVEHDRVSGVVVTIDSYGNLITNIESEMLARVRNPVVQAGGRQIALRNTYGDVPPGEFLALVNSFDVLEIACAERSAAESLGLGRGAPISVRPVD